jgi:hypothetical protein
MKTSRGTGRARLAIARSRGQKPKIEKATCPREPRQDSSSFETSTVACLKKCQTLHGVSITQHKKLRKNASLRVIPTLMFGVVAVVTPTTIAECSGEV